LLSQVNEHRAQNSLRSCPVVCSHLLIGVVQRFVQFHPAKSCVTSYNLSFVQTDIYPHSRHLPKIASGNNKGWCGMNLNYETMANDSQVIAWKVADITFWWCDNGVVRSENIWILKQYEGRGNCFPKIAWYCLKWALHNAAWAFSVEYYSHAGIGSRWGVLLGRRLFTNDAKVLRNKFRCISGVVQDNNKTGIIAGSLELTKHEWFWTYPLSCKAATSSRSSGVCWGAVLR
jgi:hypothetical protein